MQASEGDDSDDDEDADEDEDDDEDEDEEEGAGAAADVVAEVHGSHVGYAPSLFIGAHCRHTTAAVINCICRCRRELLGTAAQSDRMYAKMSTSARLENKRPPPGPSVLQTDPVGVRRAAATSRLFMQRILSQFAAAGRGDDIDENSWEEASGDDDEPGPPRLRRRGGGSSSSRAQRPLPPQVLRVDGLGL